MKKKILALAMVFTFVAATPTFAATPIGCTPRYTPVSTQAWYKNLQIALNQASAAGGNVASNISNEAIDAMVKDALKDVKINVDLGNIKLN